MARQAYPKSKIYALVADWLTTNLTVTNYCEKHQIKSGNFYRWIKEYQAKYPNQADQVTKHQLKCKLISKQKQFKNTQQQKTQHFMEIKMTESVCNEPQTEVSPVLFTMTQSSYTLQFHTLPDSKWFAQVLNQLKDA